ncbi:MAG: serine O-acetyltransferase [Bacteroidia bacterium]
MIKNRRDLKYFNERDGIALGVKKENIVYSFIKSIYTTNYIVRFQKLLRKCEYHKNNRSKFLHKVLFLYYYFFFVRLSAKLGFSIPLNVFGPGLAIVHYGTIVVSNKAKVGANCRIHPSTCIGASGGKAEAPIIGNNVYIGPGVKIYGNITIADNTAFAANAAVNKSVTESGYLIGGVPATKIKEIEIATIIKHIKH